ncbi:MAG: zinc ribbon domain-containing protein [Spirochaetales bacterium]|nr:zinc ribbon domain-containing protein [Spirochaetales bacterium]
MPTYDYECKSCGKIFEVFQKMSDAPLEVCPECGKKVKRLVGGGLGIIFKGNGFYVTDNKKSGSASSSSSVSSSSGTEPKKESKKESVAAAPSAGTGSKKE